ncbi:MAG: PII-interacting protein PipX family protein, partial [Pleurocapsa sp.]
MNNLQNVAYLNHPTFGLLYRICLLKVGQELFTTLYAQILFFTFKSVDISLSFDPISSSDARL